MVLPRTKAKSVPRFFCPPGDRFSSNKQTNPPVFPTEGKFSRESRLPGLVVTATQSFLDTMFLLTPENFPLECALERRRRRRQRWRGGKGERALFHLRGGGARVGADPEGAGRRGSRRAAGSRLRAGRSPHPRSRGIPRFQDKERRARERGTRERGARRRAERGRLLPRGAAAQLAGRRGRSPPRAPGAAHKAPIAVTPRQPAPPRPPRAQLTSAAQAGAANFGALGRCPCAAPAGTPRGAPAPGRPRPALPAPGTGRARRGSCPRSGDAARWGVSAWPAPRRGRPGPGPRRADSPRAGSDCAKCWGAPAAGGGAAEARLGSGGAARHERCEECAE